MFPLFLKSSASVTTYSYSRTEPPLGTPKNAFSYRKLFSRLRNIIIKFMGEHSVCVFVCQDVIVKERNYCGVQNNAFKLPADLCHHRTYRWMLMNFMRWKSSATGDGGEISFQPSIIFILIVMLDSFSFLRFLSARLGEGFLERRLPPAPTVFCDSGAAKTTETRQHQFWIIELWWRLFIWNFDEDSSALSSSVFETWAYL